MKATTHTKTPWVVCGNEANWMSDITSKSGTICSCEGGMEDAETNAAFIVRAVNSHEELLETLKMAYLVLTDDRVVKQPVPKLEDKIQAAISKAEGGR